MTADRVTTSIVETVDQTADSLLTALQAAPGRYCVVLDPTRHSATVVSGLVDALDAPNSADVVVASRYATTATRGARSWWRHGASRGTTLVAKAMFPNRLRSCSDPLSGCFAIDRDRVDLDELQPGASPLLEILARRERTVAEIPLAVAAQPGASVRSSARRAAGIFWQLAHLRFGRMSGFAAIGALGAVLNVAIVGLLVALGMPFLPAAVIAAEVTMIGNFVLQERLVFADLVADADGPWRRFARSFAFNNVESLVRISIAYWLVEHGVLTSAIATAVTLAVAFVFRFVFHALVVYAPRTSSAP